MLRSTSVIMTASATAITRGVLLWRGSRHTGRGRFDAAVYALHVCATTRFTIWRTPDRSGIMRATPHAYRRNVSPHEKIQQPVTIIPRQMPPVHMRGLARDGMWSNMFVTTEARDSVTNIRYRCRRAEAMPIPTGEACGAVPRQA